MSRERLTHRRAHETLTFAFARRPGVPGTHYTAGLGRYADGRLGEVFLDSHKLGSDLTDDARDIAVVLSVALQHGVSMNTVSAAVARHEDGRPCSLIGRLADVLAEHEAARSPPSAA